MEIQRKSLLAVFICFASVPAYLSAQPHIQSDNAPLIKQDTLIFKDLNRDGQLNPYEDWRLSPEERAKDLVSRLTLEEKAGLMMHGSVPSPENIHGWGAQYDLPLVTKMITENYVNSFISRLDENVVNMAEENNKLQRIAESTRLGIPVTVSVDPRNDFVYPQDNIKKSTQDFSKWPGSLGIAAIGDEAFTETYADIIRQEYRALGIHEALSPQADLATEPRWSRTDGSFGEDPDLVGRMVGAYVRGLQYGNKGINPNSIMTVVKHWVGYGAAENGYDGHNSYGKTAIIPTEHDLQTHIKPFLPAFQAHVAGVMPTYSILKDLKIHGAPIEQVGAGFNQYLLQDLLRHKYGFNGLIVSDWLITSDCEGDCVTGAPEGVKPEPKGMPWGVERLTVQQRFVKAVIAGIDQFGGVADISPLVNAVKQHELTESRLSESAERVLIQKFQLGLFENPYVDAKKAKKIVGKASFVQQGIEAQKRALVLLEKRDNLLPIRKGIKVFLHGVDRDIVKQAGLKVVDSLESADIALIRTVTPYEQPHKGFFFGARYHEGSLDFPEDSADLAIIRQASAKVPTIVTVYLDRPAILTKIKPLASVIIGNFGVSDRALVESLTQTRHFTGKLPFELPSSMDAVLNQHTARPHDSEKPLYPFGFGLQ